MKKLLLALMALFSIAGTSFAMQQTFDYSRTKFNVYNAVKNLQPNQQFTITNVPGAATELLKTAGVKESPLYIKDEAGNPFAKNTASIYPYSGTTTPGKGTLTYTVLSFQERQKLAKTAAPKAILPAAAAIRAGAALPTGTTPARTGFPVQKGYVGQIVQPQPQTGTSFKTTEVSMIPEPKLADVTMTPAPKGQTGFAEPIEKAAWEQITPTPKGTIPARIGFPVQEGYVGQMMQPSAQTPAVFKTAEESFIAPQKAQPGFVPQPQLASIEPVPKGQKAVISYTPELEDVTIFEKQAIQTMISAPKGQIATKTPFTERPQYVGQVALQQPQVATMQLQQPKTIVAPKTAEFAQAGEPTGVATPFSTAVSEEAQISARKELMEAVERVRKATTQLGKTYQQIFYDAISSGDIEVFAELLRNRALNKIEVNKISPAGKTPIELAIEANTPEYVKDTMVAALISNNADVNLPLNRFLASADVAKTNFLIKKVQPELLDRALLTVRTLSIVEKDANKKARFAQIIDSLQKAGAK